MIQILELTNSNVEGGSLGHTRSAEVELIYEGGEDPKSPNVRIRMPLRVSWFQDWIVQTSGCMVAQASGLKWLSEGWDGHQPLVYICKAMAILSLD